jgi:DNA-directed RNA polymerase specialized sigma24 family protein
MERLKHKESAEVLNLSTKTVESQMRMVFIKQQYYGLQNLNLEFL